MLGHPVQVVAAAAEEVRACRGHDQPPFHGVVHEVHPLCLHDTWWASSQTENLSQYRTPSVVRHRTHSICAPDGNAHRNSRPAATPVPDRLPPTSVLGRPPGDTRGDVGRTV